MVDVHLNEVMSHAALGIILSLEQQMRTCEDARLRGVLPDGLPLCSIFDEIDEQQQNANQSNAVGNRDNNNTYTTRDSMVATGSGVNYSSSAMGGNKMLGMNSTNNISTKKQFIPMYKKKPSGRIHKWMGDLAMQVCSPRDAIEHYSVAITECKATGETLWLAGALDGYASAVLLLIQMQANLEEIIGKELRNTSVGGNNNSGGSANASGAGNAGSGSTGVGDNNNVSSDSSNIEKAYRLAEDRVNEAIAIYASNIIFCALEVECILRVARMHESRLNHSNRESKVMEYVLRAASVPGLNTQQQIECTLEGGLICHRLGMWRKYALFLFIAALMSADNNNYGVAQALVCYIIFVCL